MSTELIPTEHKHQQPMAFHRRSGSDAVYGIGLVGAWVYYLRRATTLRQGVEGFFKGLVWPAFLVYELFVFLKKD